MKKLTAILLTIILAFMFTACGDKNEQPETDDTTKNSVADSVLKGEIPEVEHALGTSVEDIEEYYNNLEKQMEESHEGEGHVHDDTDILLNKKADQIALHAVLLESLSPLKILSRGYCVAQNGEKTISSVNMVETGDSLKILFNDGSVNATVIEKEEGRNYDI